MDHPVGGINRMEPPASGDEIKPEKLEEAKEGGPLFHCDLSDSEAVYKIAQALLPGLASACVDNTTGDLLRSSASIAVDIRRDMVDYLVQRSENFVAESVVLEGGTESDVSDNPFDIVSNFIDDFAASKRNFLSKVSGWVLSDRREDRIDDFLQEMELNGFWLIGRRESVARTLLKNVDFKNAFHCDMKFKASEELDDHRFHCSFRTTTCTHEGCDSIFSTCHLEQHESVCPFKILPCEQKCPDSIMRREMDRHCITVCTMKLVNCPFYQLGCHSTTPQCKINEHLRINLQSHILDVLRISHKGFSEDSLKKRLDEIEKISSLDHLASLRDARSLTNAVKNYERKLGPMEEIKVEPDGDVKDGQLENKGSTSSSSRELDLSTEKNRQSTSSSEKSTSPVKLDKMVDSLTDMKKLSESSDQSEEHEKSHIKRDDQEDSPFKGHELKESIVKINKKEDSPVKSDMHESASDESDKQEISPTKIYDQKDSPIRSDELEDTLTKINKKEDSPVKSDAHESSSDESKEHENSPTKKYDLEDSPSNRHELEDSLVNIIKQEDSPVKSDAHESLSDESDEQEK